MRCFLALIGALGAAAAALSAAVVPDAAPGARFTGAVRVVDGDTIDVGGTRVRLHAVDAPERDQTCETTTNKSWACGGWVSKAVANRYEGAHADCERLDTDRYGRTVARCFVDREDIGAWLVREGLAFAYVRYGADYAALEREAEAHDRGLHAVRMELPSAYRAGRRTAQP